MILKSSLRTLKHVKTNPSIKIWNRIHPVYTVLSAYIDNSVIITVYTELVTYTDNSSAFYTTTYHLFLKIREVKKDKGQRGWYLKGYSKRNSEFRDMIYYCS